MNPLNLIFSLSSLSVILVTIERFSFTGKILLSPFGFLRLHEIIQMTILILITVILPFYLLREVSNNFETIKTKKGFILALLFIIGIYFYATGNGLHEVSSFNLNNFCDAKYVSGNLCQTFFINDYYTGNILYFVGGVLMVIPVLLLEKLNPNKNFSKKDLPILYVNSAVYAFAIFAYAAFDKVLVGLVYSIIVTVISIYLFLKVRNNYLKYPVLIYTLTTYTLGTILALIFRFR